MSKPASLRSTRSSILSRSKPSSVAGETGEADDFAADGAEIEGMETHDMAGIEGVEGTEGESGKNISSRYFCSNLDLKQAASPAALSSSA